MIYIHPKDLVIILVRRKLNSGNNGEQKRWKVINKNDENND